MTNITIGQYYPVKSYIHALDARVKLISMIAYIVVLFLLKNVWGYLLAVFCIGCVIYISKVPLRFIIRGLKNIVLIVTFTVVLNIFFTPGTKVVFEVWKLTVTVEGLLLAATLGGRLVLLIMGSSLLTLTTTPIQLTDAIEYLLKPFKKIGVPAHEIAMMMTIALRFIPTLLEELDKIMKAQMARGADFDTGGLIKKAQSLIPLMVPLFVSSFRRADELAMAMEARCYRGDYMRTKMKELKLQPLDYRAMLLVSVFSLAMIATRFVV